MEHRLGRAKLNFKYPDIMLSSSTWGICIDYSGAHGTHAAEGERCRYRAAHRTPVMEESSTTV